MYTWQILVISVPVSAAVLGMFITKAILQYRILKLKNTHEVTQNEKHYAHELALFDRKSLHEVTMIGKRNDHESSLLDKKYVAEGAIPDKKNQHDLATANTKKEVGVTVK